jgi:threonine/homoserine/homoserine lactone efflux protein
MGYQVFFISFIVSYLGSIPPGTINISAMQMTILGYKRAALFFALAASLTEFAYAGITVKFQIFLSESPFITDHFQIITAIAMLGLGILNLTSKTKSSKFERKDSFKGRNGFKSGVLLGLLNPLTIPFWLAVTAYLQSNEWISLTGSYFWIYLTGISTGTFALLLTINVIGKKFTSIADNQFIVYKVPGVAFICLGLYNLIGWLSY